MNCHGNNNTGGNKNGGGHKGHIAHMLLMALCCGAPILIVLLLPLIGKIGGEGVSRTLGGIAPFLCPLMMIFMLPMMFRRNKNQDAEDNCHQNTQQMLPEEKSAE